MLTTVIIIVLAAMFLVAGSSKVFGAKMQVDSFNKLKLPQWFRVVTGLMQFIGIAALIIGLWETSWAAWAGIWFGIMMLLAAAAHLRIKDPIAQAFPALVLMILSVVLTILNSSTLNNLLG